MQLADQFRALGAGMSLKVSSLLLVAGEGHKPVAPLSSMRLDGTERPALAWATQWIKPLLVCRLLCWYSAALLWLLHCTTTCWTGQPLC